MDPTLTRTIGTLRTARDALRSEMEVWSRARTLDEARLERLRETARSFQEQAHSVLVMMAFQDTPEALQQEVEALVAGFGQILDQVDAVLAAGKPS